MIGSDVDFDSDKSKYWEDLKKTFRNIAEMLDLEDSENVINEIKSKTEPVYRDFDDILENPHLGPTYTPVHGLCDGTYPQNSKSHS